MNKVERGGREDILSEVSLRLWRFYLHFQNIVLQYIRISLYSMEKQHQSSQQGLCGRPCKPLQGYFRFRQEMMSILQQSRRNSQSIVELWNKLTQGERAALNQREQQQTINYKELIPNWIKNEQIPLQGQNVAAEQGSSAVVLAAIENVALDNASFGEKEKLVSGSKKKMIKKSSQLSQTKRNCK